MSTQASTPFQTPSILSTLGSAVDAVADGVSRLTRCVPDTYHRHITDNSLPESIQEVMPFVRYITSNISDQLKETAHEGLQDLIDHRCESRTADLKRRLKWGTTIGDIRSSFKGTRPSDRAARSSMSVVEGWFHGGSTPSEQRIAKEDITKADRLWTRPVMGGVGAMAAVTAYSTVSQYF